MLNVIIVNYRTGRLAVSCTESLEAERSDLPRLHVTVVDNNSQDGSADLIEAAIRARGWDWVTLIRSPANGGFSAGNNIGIRAAFARASPPDLIWLLNPDTRVMPGAALALVRFMADMPRAGIAGSLTLEEDGTPWPYAFRFPTILGEIERGSRWSVMSRLLRNWSIARVMGEDCARVDWVQGASMAIRRQVLEQGLLDEDYFLYYEETDFCRQALRNGWECWYVPQSVVLHMAGQSTGVTSSDATLKRLPAYWFRSRQHYFTKNHGRLYAMMADFGWIAGHLLFLSRQFLSRKRVADHSSLLQDFIRHSALWPQRR
jgi:GT2 family glycosyltransferase